MTTDGSPLLPECPNCGAPLDLKRLAKGLVTCSYCGNAVALASIPALAADPALARKIEQEALPPTLFAKLFGNNFSLFAGLLAGFAIVFAWFVFARQPDDNEIAVCVFAAAAALCAIGWKRRLYAALLSLAVGALVAAKPFLRPIISTYDGQPYSPTSETALYFVIPGALLVGLAVVVVLRIRPARFRTDLALLVPRPLASLGVALGVFVGLLLFAGKTSSDILCEYGAFLDARRQQYRVIADWIDAPGRPELPSTAPRLNPLPFYAEEDPRSNVDIVPIDRWKIPANSVPADLLLNGFLSNALDRRAKPYWHDEWKLDDALASIGLPTAAAIRYLVAYRCEERSMNSPISGCNVWLFALDTSAPLLSLSLPESRDFFEMRDDVLSQLSRATGGTFLLERR